ncbi:MAG: 4-deoxy-4-formamido-L-arabinose-phosphoundecaprenol deformylase [Desulfobacteraceae bacterium]|nr:4-deoxy-4-formamido-L-arabinose-phosphoundecaprenol deformylase [Desulfobacteraceae bacterium]
MDAVCKAGCGIGEELFLGLRIDVDTLTGARRGVPRLLAVLKNYGIRASIFFSVGPDNMGRHLWRLMRPGFLKKMLRTNAASLYGWDILLRGTAWPGPNIGERTSSIIQAAAEDGHEIGLHAWDHHGWQARLDRMDAKTIDSHIRRGFDFLTRILGTPPVCSAAPAWKINDAALLCKTAFPFQYNSDCRGTRVFYPVVAGNPLSQPQIPATLPTYDEVIGKPGVNHGNYNAFILSRLVPGKLNVLTIHAEAEGMSLRPLFEDFIRMARSRGVVLGPLGQILKDSGSIPPGVVTAGKIEGREGWAAVGE